jgi:hypothetical protein
MKAIITAWVLLFGFLDCSASLSAGERRGNELLVQLKNGVLERGELITVRTNSIILVGSSSGVDITIEVSKISRITVIKKSKALLHGGLGALIGVGLGVAIGFISGGGDIFGYHNVEPGPMAIILGLCGAAVGGTGGLIEGAISGADEEYRLEGKSEAEIQAIIRGLAPHARIRDYS